MKFIKKILPFVANRYFIVSLGFVLGKKEKLAQTRTEQTNQVETPRLVRIINGLTNLREKISFSAIIRLIVILLIGFVISFGWNLAINWSSVKKLNAELSKTLPGNTVESSAIYLTQTAVLPLLVLICSNFWDSGYK